MRNDGIFFLTSGAPQGGAALAPYKGFAESETLGAGRIHSARACEMERGSPRKAWLSRGGQKEDAELGNGTDSDRGIHGGA